MESVGSACGVNLVPQPMQKLASAGFALPQFGQFTGSTCWQEFSGLRILQALYADTVLP